MKETKLLFLMKETDRALVFNDRQSSCFNERDRVLVLMIVKYFPIFNYHVERTKK